MPRTLTGQGHPLALASEQLKILRPEGRFRPFEAALAGHGLAPLRAAGLHVLQMNLGKMCNQTCRHCHVDAGPDRREEMSRETMEQCLAALAKTAIPTVDLTGGAPEMNPHFRWLVEEVRRLGRHVMDRCNLTILETAPHADLPDFFARHRVEVVCSLPHYRALNTDKQRGEGVYEKSIRALKRLNAVGYGDGKSGLRLGVLDNSKGNADHLLRFIVEGVKAAVPVASVVSLRKESVSLPATGPLLDRLAAEADLVVSAMAD